ncbi:hypothetical protein NIES4072_72950 [Nostoc commune NIES-4072]|uniref:MazG nucleotide pyrophosphohydrolase n=1 Tax=Nostoc commune NIES-4072 TaxID=2005467 RepID=A0A2R5G552_NOSCO|nr:hypothetical protein [Nostoc commune]BBD70929.1 hypothetical protein NIES4070_73400 [Nostoc commune HK-02]GBG23583.1 hypothetical protein NIES4072_72950 [Nostoc commune NIES-4072]
MSSIIPQTQQRKVIKASGLKTVISGSYRKHLREISLLKDFLITEGIEVLAPVSCTAINVDDEFIILDSDPLKDPRILQDSIFGKMRQSSFHVILNKNGYLGNAAVLELGYAIALGLQILTLEEVIDPNISVYCRRFIQVFPNWRGFE